MNFIFSNPSFPIIACPQKTDVINVSNSLNACPLSYELIESKNSEELFKRCFPKDDYKENKEEEK